MRRVSTPASQVQHRCLPTSTPANRRIAPIVDSDTAPLIQAILSRIPPIAEPLYFKHSMSKFPSVAANNRENMTAFESAGSVKPVRKTAWKFWNASSSVILKTGSEATLALPMFPSVKNNSRLLRWVIPHCSLVEFAAARYPREACQTDRSRSQIKTGVILVDL